MDKIASKNTISSKKLQQDKRYMQLAIEQAKKAAAIDEVPIGAVVVLNASSPDSEEHQLVSAAHNLCETSNNPAGHAEFLAIQEASKKLGRWRLNDCTVYVTLEPCIMCAGLMHQARIARCVYGASDKKAGALGTLYSIHEDERLNHNFEVVAGIYEDKCVNLLQEFFKNKR